MAKKTPERRFLLWKYRASIFLPIPGWAIIEFNLLRWFSFSPWRGISEVNDEMWVANHPTLSSWKR